MSLGGAYEVLSYAVYVRTSVIIARIAAAQSGRQLPTLSGRAILDPVGEGEGDIDECRKSLLGSIVGVTAEIEKSRNTARALAATGVVQRSVGVKPGTFDEKGQLDDPAARARRAARAAEAKQRAHAQAQAHLLMPTQLPQHLMNNKPPSAPASESGESHASSKRKARKTAQAQSAAAASRKEKPAALRKELEVVTSAQTTQPADEAKSNAKSITYINLDSDSEPDSAPIRTNASRSKVTRKDSDSSDSRYTVKKAAKVPPEPADAKYGANGIVDMDSSDSDSDVVLVTSRGQSDTKGSGKANNSGKSSGSSTPSKKESKKSRRKKRKAKQEAEAAAAAAAAASSDMDMSDSTSSREKAKRPTNSHPTPKRNKPTSPLRSTKLTNAQRKDYWNAKGHIADKHTVDSDSDSDTVHVRSK